MAEDASSMNAAMGNINEMKEKKRLIEMHVSVSFGIRNELKSRHLDKYFEIGSAIIHNKTLRTQERKDLLNLFEEISMQKQ